MPSAGFLEDKSWCRLVQPGLFWEQAGETLFRGSQQNRAVLFSQSAVKLWWLLLLGSGLGLLG